MLFHEINLFLLIFLITCSLFVDATTTSPPPTTVPSVEEKLQRVFAFTEGITAIAEVFNSPEPVGRNLSKLLEGSRKCGLVLHAGLALDGIENSPVVGNLRNKSWDLSHALNVQEIGITPDLIPSVTGPLKYLADRFKEILLFYSSEELTYFKGTCDRISDLATLESMIDKLDGLEIDVVASGYGDKLFQEINKTYHHTLKQAIGFYPLCHIFLKGLPNTVDQQKGKNSITAALKTIHKRLAYINAERKKNYWTNENIAKIVTKYAEYTKWKEDIMDDLYKDLFENYKSFGYNYHVGISNAAQRGHNDTLIQCSTECLYLYNFFGTDIYVMRTKNSDNYSSCDHLDNLGFSSLDFDGKCSKNFNENESLVPLANDISERCKGVAFSLVRSKLDYFAKAGVGFTSKCKDGIYVVFANYALS